MIAKLRSELGTGAPVVYVPGIDGTGAFLMGTEERLGEHFHLFTLRYEAGGEDTYEALARSVVETAAERIEGRFILLSESFGGAVALQAALDHPDKVAGLAVINSFCHYRRRVRIALSRWFGGFMTPKLFGFARRAVVPHGLLGPRRTPELVDAFLRTTLTKFDESYQARLAMIQGLDLRPRLAEIEQPVLLCAAENDRVVDSLPAARVMAAGLPNAELITLPNAGHLVLPLPEEPWVERLQRLAERAGFTA